MAVGTNGTVQSVSSNGAATVDFPGPPPYSRSFVDLTDAERQTLLAAMGDSLKVDVTYDDTVTPANVTGVTVHR